MCRRKWVSQDKSIYLVARNDGELIYQGKQVEKISNYLIREGKILFLQGFLCSRREYSNLELASCWLKVGQHR